MKNLNPNALALALMCVYSSWGHASAVRDDVDYQQFRDFAENKGRFSIGASNLPVFDQNGQLLGNILPNTPMINFDPVIRQAGHSTLVDDQYLHSVMHNSGYRQVNFGADNYRRDAHVYDYLLTDRNNYRGENNDQAGEFENQGIFYRQGRGDYHTPRLHKLVTEVAPAQHADLKISDQGYNSDIFLDSTRYEDFVRAGAGKQQIANANGTMQDVTDAYHFLTGGTALPRKTSNEGLLSFRGKLFGENSTPLSSFALLGDSGSGFFAYDKIDKKWEYVGALTTLGGDGIQENSVNHTVLFSPELLQSIQNKDTAGIIHTTTAGQNYDWISLSPNSSLLGGLSVDLYDATLEERGNVYPAFEHGKTVHFQGENSTITLQNDLNQGAGALYFHADATVQGKHHNTQHRGAGISVAEGKQVTWKVHNPADDRLSKIGKGTLLINATGKNLGEISVGDGTVILNQQANQNQEKQAFSRVGIVSGRATVKLGSADQVDPNHIYFGHRGGRLDVNGHDLTFQHIQNLDDGAKIVNHANQTANIRITGKKPYTADDLLIQRWDQPFGDLYEYTHPVLGNTASYYALRHDRHDKAFPSIYHTGESNEHWEFLGFDKQDAINTILARKNQTAHLQGYDGFFGETDSTLPNGRLNVQFDPTQSQQTLLMTGGTHLNGDFSVQNGTVMLSGRPTPHARDKLKNLDVAFDDDWLNRQFKAEHFYINNAGRLDLGRNVTRFDGKLILSNQATANLGIANTASPICTRSDYTGEIACTAKVLDAKAWASIPTTHIASDVRLHDQAKLTLNPTAKLHGTIHADTGTQVDLHESHWHMTGDSQIDQLNMHNATVTLNPDFAQGTSSNYHRLDIGHLTGQGTFHVLSDIANLQADHIHIGNASGDFKLNIKNSGAEPNHNQRLNVLSTEQENQFTVSLTNPNAGVDIGAYRYELIKDQQNYRLYSPKIEQEFFDKAEQERLEQEKAQAEYISRYTNAGLSELASQANSLNQIHTGITSQILADDAQNIWLNLETSQGKTHQSDLYRPFEKDDRLMQIGVKHDFKNKNGELNVGAIYSNHQSEQQFADHINNQADTQMLSFFAKQKWDNQTFATIDAGIGTAKQQLNSANESSEFKHQVASTGIQVGKTFDTPVIDVQPSIGLRYDHINAQDYTLNQAEIRNNDVGIVSYRAGLKLSKDIQTGNGLTIQPSLSSHWNDSIDSETTVQVNGHQFQQDFGAYHQHEIGLGLKYEQWGIDLKGTYAKGDEISQQKSAGIKISYEW